MTTTLEQKIDSLVESTNNLTNEVEGSVLSIKQEAQASIDLANQQVSKAGEAHRLAVESASGGKNTVIYDDQGNPNVMVRIPRFNYEDLNQAILDKTGADLQLGSGTPTMFLTNGVEQSEIYIAKYLASAGDNGGCSVIGGVQPRISVNYDEAKALCSSKGTGWHMMSIHEWAAIALWSFANDTIPRGNTNNGRSHEKKIETARRSDNGVPGDTSGIGRTDTGEGGDKWSHDHSSSGIQDLVGNVWEWLDQMMLDEGQVIATLDNNPAIEPIDWNKHTAYFDSPNNLTAGTASAGSPILSPEVLNSNGATGDNEVNNPYLTEANWAGITKHWQYTPIELLRRLLLESSVPNNVTGAILARNYGKRFPVRGGSFANGSLAGLGALNLNFNRLYSASNIGFRPAFFGS